MSKIPSFIKEERKLDSQDLLSLYFRLFRSLPLFLKFLPLTIIFILLSSAAPSFFRWYAGNYTTHSGDPKHETFTLSGLLLILGLSTLFRILAWVFFETTGMWSSQELYSKMIQGLSKTRTTFFDENPSGRIINRLIRDYDEVRSTAIIFVGDFFNAIIEVLSIAGVACFASPWAAFMAFPLIGMFFFIQTQRSAMIEHCRTLSAIASSQVLNRKNDLIEGREIFILYGKGNHLLDRMKESVINYIQASLLTIQVDTWASFWIRVFAETFSFFVLIFIIFGIHSHQMSIPIAGVIISSLFGITGSIGWLDFASSLVSRSTPHLRRVFEFVDLPQEHSEEFSKMKETLLFKNELKSLQNFLEGDIQFIHYSMSYRKDSPLILKDLCLTLPEGTKTALIGRTGSGKSSIIQALMRMVYVKQGDIQIAKQSIYQMEISHLRRHFGVVPQSPYLFAATLKQNLDLTGSLNGELLEEALSAVGLKYPLHFQVTEGGSNLSLGERQLICLARVIASNRSFILMDEPTSGLDPVTDARMNQILHTSLRNKTVLTIAHRKETLKNYDFIIEMRDGSIV